MPLFLERRFCFLFFFEKDLMQPRRALYYLLIMLELQKCATLSPLQFHYFFTSIINMFIYLQNENPGTIL